jgi:hypothetical protein
MVAAALVGVQGHVAVENVALVLVLVVMLGAVMGGRRAGVVSAVVAALSLDFFHTRPYNSLKVSHAEDVQSMLLFLAVALAMAEIVVRADRIRAATQVQREEIVRLHRVAELAASDQPVDDLISALCAELINSLRLQDCAYEPAPFSYDLPAMEASGVVAGSLHRFTREGFELPHERLVLRVITGGRTVGRFVLTPTPGAGVSMDRRRVAVALVDQLGVVLSRAS